MLGGDIDGDGDIDRVLVHGGTVSVCGSFSSQDLVLVTDGTGRFRDAAPRFLPVDQQFGVAGVLADLDRYVLDADTSGASPRLSQDALQTNRLVQIDTRDTTRSGSR